MALVLKGAVADFAESVKEYGAAKRILGHGNDSRQNGPFARWP
jgi:hypothetical protein